MQTKVVIASFTTLTTVILCSTCFVSPKKIGFWTNGFNLFMNEDADPVVDGIIFLLILAVLGQIAILCRSTVDFSQRNKAFLRRTTRLTVANSILLFVVAISSSIVSYFSPTTLTNKLRTISWISFLFGTCGSMTIIRAINAAQEKGTNNAEEVI